MITGIVNADFEPIIPLSIRGSDGKVYTQEVIVVDSIFGVMVLGSMLMIIDRLAWVWSLAKPTGGNPGEFRSFGAIVLGSIVYGTLRERDY
jgi:hypothetical protein